MNPIALVLETSGLVGIAFGSWRSYAHARAAMAPLAHEGDPTRTAIEAGRPIVRRSRVRLFARRVAVSIAWLLVAMYGLFLLATGMGLAT